MTASQNQAVEKQSAEAQQQSPGPTKGSRLPQNQPAGECKDGFFETLRTVFGPCVGAVDVASVFFQNSCRAKEGEGKDMDGAGKQIVQLNMKNPLTKVKKRQGETLEFPSNGHFDDDVSAISQHTLEEMEKLHLLKLLPSAKVRSGSGKPAPGSTLTPKGVLPRGQTSVQVSKKAHPSVQVSTKDHRLTFPPQRESSDPSICVSTSGSASSEEINSPIKHKNRKGLRILSRAEI